MAVAAAIPDIGELGESLEMYLKTVFQLVEEKRVARVRDIAERRNVRMPSVTGALKRLAKQGLIDYEAREFVTLTQKGEDLAREILDRDTLLRRFLAEVLMLDAEAAERDACVLEHYVSPETLARIAAFTEFVDTEPKQLLAMQEQFRKWNSSRAEGEPRKGKAPVGGDGKQLSLGGLAPGQKARVVSVNARPAIRQRLIDMGVLPGVEIELVRVAPLGDPVLVRLKGYRLSLRKDEATSIEVQPA